MILEKRVTAKAEIRLVDLAESLSQKDLADVVDHLPDEQMWADLWEHLTKLLLRYCWTWCPNCLKWFRDGMLKDSPEGMRCPQCQMVIVWPDGKDVADWWKGMEG